MITNKGVEKPTIKAVGGSLSTRGVTIISNSFALKRGTGYPVKGAGKLQFRLPICKVKLGGQPRQTNGKTKQTKTKPQTPPPV